MFETTSQELTKLYICPEGKNKNNCASSELFEAMINPASISYGVNIVYNDDPPTGVDGQPQQYHHTGPETMGFSLYLDATGAVNPEAETVDKQVEQFKKVTVEYKTEDHEPQAVTIHWGKFSFDCRLKTLSIDYSLFNPDGTPLRAKLELSFVGHLKMKDTQAVQHASPDLSHVVTVKSGDTLPLICEKIYGDSSLYLEIARVNGLVNFRKLEPGQELVFPPIKK